MQRGRACRRQQLSGRGVYYANRMPGNGKLTAVRTENKLAIVALPVAGGERVGFLPGGGVKQRNFPAISHRQPSAIRTEGQLSHRGVLNVLLDFGQLSARCRIPHGYETAVAGVRGQRSEEHTSEL